MINKIASLIYKQENEEQKTKTYQYRNRAIEILDLIEQYMIPKDKIKLSHLDFEDNGWEDETH